MTPSNRLIPNHPDRNRLDPAEHIRLHPVQLRPEFFSFFARIEHKRVVNLSGSQLFAFPKSVSHFRKYSSLHFYKHKGRANVSSERALFKSYLLRSITFSRQRPHIQHR